MRSKVIIHVAAVPVAQPRHRIGTVNGKAMAFGAKKSHPIHVFKAAVQSATSIVMLTGPLPGPVSLVLDFVMPRTKGQMWKRKPMPRINHTKKPDIDNLVKGVLDAMTGIAWIDDTQVVQLHASKVIAAGDEQPHVRITITDREDEHEQMPRMR